MKTNNMENKIFRSLGTILRAAEDDDSRRIEGYAIVFNSWSRDLGGFIEKINPEAITEELLRESDVIMNLNHDDNQMLARYRQGEGTLSLELREDGLYFSFDAPTTALGDEVLYNVRHGNLYECSFCCMLNRDDVKRYKEGDTYVQEINRIALLHDCSIVVTAAYPATSVSARSAEEAAEEFLDIKREVDEREAAEREAAEKEEQARKEQEIINQLDSLRESFLNDIESAE